MRTRFLFPVFVFATLFLFISGCATTGVDKRGFDNKWFGTKAPDFELRDIHGKTHRLSDYEGKVVLIYFSMWCMTCLNHTLHLKDMVHAKYRDKDLVILEIDYTGADLEGLKRLSKEMAIPFSILMDDGSLTKYYNGAMAVTVIIDRQGIIQYKYFFTKKSIEVIEALLGG